MNLISSLTRSLVVMALLTASTLAAQPVTTTAGLASALTAANAAPTTPATINLAAGTYALTIDLPTLAANSLTLQGPTTGAPAILDATGLASGVIFNVTADQIVIANLTLRNARSHAVAIQPGADSGRIADCAIDNPTAPFPATAAIDGNGCQNWTVTGNTISGIIGSTATAEPAIHFYGGASGTTVTNNLIQNCDRAIGLGGDPTPVVPAITTQPINVTVTAGQTATFTVVATGTPPPTYQWLKNGTAISGATFASYTTPTTTAVDSGAKFSVVVTNSAGNATSQNSILTVDPVPTGKTYYLDANNGADTYDGSQAHPWKSFKKALGSVQAHDVVLMNSGDYGSLVAGRTKDVNQSWGDFALPAPVFTDWVTFKAAPGQEPHATNLDLGTLNTTALTSNNLSIALDFSVKGNADAFLRFDGLTFDDGINILGTRYVQVVNCKIHRIGDLSGAVENIDRKAGVQILNGRYVTLRGNDITHVSIGVAAATYDLAILSNDIHHNSHDGIRVWGGDTWLIEGNRIHDLDDGVDDTDGVDWNRHTDGMQVWTLIDVTNNVTVRGNLFYHLECMGIMLQESEITGRRYTNWVFENNIFGPVGGILFHGGTTIEGRFVFRHNTIAYAPNDVWVSIYPKNLATGADRTFHSDQYLLQWPDCPNEGSIYNNLFADGSEADVYPGSALSFTGCNRYRETPSTGNLLARGDKVSATLPYEAIPGNINDYLNATGHLPGTLTATNDAIDAGTRIGNDYVTPLADQLMVDFNGQPRDNRPDIGALEAQGRSPATEVFNFLPDPAAPLHFVDDFSDGRLFLRDPFLNGTDTTGILWLQPDGNNNFRSYNDHGEPKMNTVFNLTPALAVTSKAFRNITFAFDFSGPFSDCGAVLLYQDLNNYTYVDFGGRLVRRAGGTDTVLATVVAPSVSGRAAIAISSSGTTVTLTMKVDGKTLWTNTGTAPFQTGAVGFYRNRTTGNGWDRIDYDNIEIDLVTAGDLIGNLNP